MNLCCDKSNLTFDQFDFCKFYPSISEEVIGKAISFARKCTHISEKDEALIIHTCKSFIYNTGQAWVKKGKTIIDVTMGCFAGAKKCGRSLSVIQASRTRTQGGSVQG